MPRDILYFLCAKLFLTFYTWQVPGLIGMTSRCLLSCSPSQTSKQSPLQRSGWKCGLLGQTKNALFVSV
jgi:hypothetical protein